MFEIKVNLTADQNLLAAVLGLVEAIGGRQRGEEVSHPGQMGMGLEPSLPPVQTPPETVPTESVSTGTVAQMTTVPVTESVYTIDQLAVAASALMDAGNMAVLQEILSGFGVQALTQLPKEQYGAFAAALREKGAKI